MSNKLIDTNGLLYFKQKLDGIFATKVDKADGMGLSTNDYTTVEKNKLAGIDEGATKTEIVNNLESTSATSALSAAQGKALDDKIATLQGEVDNLGVGDMLASVYDADGDGKVDDAAKLGGQLPSYYAPASEIPTTVAQLTDQATYANKIETVKVDGTALQITDKTVNIDLSGKVDVEQGKGLSTNDYTTDEKTKLADIEEGANKTTIVDALNSTSTTSALSAAQGKVLDEKIATINTALDEVALKSDLTNAYIYQGSVANVAALPATSTNGYVYNVEDTGMNYAWNGSAWDNLGAIYSFDYAQNSDIDEMFA